MTNTQYPAVSEDPNYHLRIAQRSKTMPVAYLGQRPSEKSVTQMLREELGINREQLLQDDSLDDRFTPLSQGEWKVFSKLRDL